MTDMYLGIVMEYASGGNLFDYVSKGCAALVPAAGLLTQRVPRTARTKPRPCARAQEGPDRAGRALVLQAADARAGLLPQDGAPGRVGRVTLTLNLLYPALFKEPMLALDYSHKMVRPSTAWHPMPSSVW